MWGLFKKKTPKELKLKRNKNWKPLAERAKENQRHRKIKQQEEEANG